jgi:hypothetical protein
MIYEAQSNSDRRRIRIFAFLGASIILIIALLISPLITMTVERKTIPEYMAAVLERYLKITKPEVQVEPESIPIRKTRAPRRQRIVITREANLDNPSLAKFEPLTTRRTTRERQVDFDDSRIGSSRLGIPEPSHSNFQRANVPTGESLRMTRDIGGEGSGSGRGRQFNPGMSGPAIVSGGAGPGVALESGGPRIVIPKTPPKDKPVGTSINPIIDWIERHQKPIPVVLQRPENLNQMPGDVTTWVIFMDTEDQEYTMFLLGRKGDPPQLNIFLKYQREGTLLQDLGAKGVNEVFKHGDAIGDFDKLTVQLSLLPPGSQKATEMMAIFQAWWAQARKAEG